MRALAFVLLFLALEIAAFLGLTLILHAASAPGIRAPRIDTYLVDRIDRYVKLNGKGDPKREHAIRHSIAKEMESLGIALHYYAYQCRDVPKTNEAECDFYAGLAIVLSDTSSAIR